LAEPLCVPPYADTVAGRAERAAVPLNIRRAKTHHGTAISVPRHLPLTGARIPGGAVAPALRLMRVIRSTGAQVTVNSAVSGDAGEIPGPALFTLCLCGE